MTKGLNFELCGVGVCLAILGGLLSIEFGIQGLPVDTVVLPLVLFTACGSFFVWMASKAGAG